MGTLHDTVVGSHTWQIRQQRFPKKMKITTDGIVWDAIVEPLLRRFKRSVNARISATKTLFYITNILLIFIGRSQVEMSRLLFGNIVTRQFVNEFINAMEISLMGGFHGYSWDHYHAHAGARPP